MSDPLLDRLSVLDACAISDALDRAGLSGVALGLTALSGDRRICGRAITVQLGPDDGRASKRHLGTAAAEAAGPGSVIVIAHGRTDVAGWGGILSLAAKTRGAEGVVVDGACRDIDESREMDLPVFAHVAVPVTARGRVIEHDWNCEVSISGVAVSPGDYVMADGSGVVFIPAAQAEAIIAAAETIVERERRMAAEVRAGRPVSEVMGASYETMLKDAR